MFSSQKRQKKPNRCLFTRIVFIEDLQGQTKIGFFSKGFCVSLHFFFWIHCPDGGIGRHEGLKILWPLRLYGFKSRSGHIYFLSDSESSPFFLPYRLANLFASLRKDIASSFFSSFLFFVSSIDLLFKSSFFCCLVCDGFITLFYTPQKKYKQKQEKEYRHQKNN